MALDHFALMRVLLLRLAAALPIAAFIAIAISLLSQRGIQLMPSGMTLVNMALVLLPFLCNVMAVVLAPDRAHAFALHLRAPRTLRAPHPARTSSVAARTSSRAGTCSASRLPRLRLHHPGGAPRRARAGQFGLHRLHLLRSPASPSTPPPPTPSRTLTAPSPLTLTTSPHHLTLTRYASLSFNPQTRWEAALEQLQMINSSFYPNISTWEFMTSEEMKAYALDAGLRSEAESDTTYYTAGIYLLAAHLLGVIHNRKLHSNLFNHANLLHEHSENMSIINEEVVNCQLLLENIFPQEVRASQAAGRRRGPRGRAGGGVQRLHLPLRQGRSNP